MILCRWECLRHVSLLKEYSTLVRERQYALRKTDLHETPTTPMFCLDPWLLIKAVERARQTHERIRQILPPLTPLFSGFATPSLLA